MQSLLAKIRNTRASQAETSGEDLADNGLTFGRGGSETREIPTACPNSADHRKLSTPWRSAAIADSSALLFSPFAKQSYLKGFGYLEITSSQIRDLLHAAAGIEHRRQQSVITASLQGGPIDGFENRVNFSVFQVIDGPLSCSLEGKCRGPVGQTRYARDYGRPQNEITVSVR